MGEIKNEVRDRVEAEFRPHRPRPPMTALEEILAERQRQVVKGYNATHDDSHTGGEIAQAAAAFALSASGKSMAALMLWPWRKHEFDDGNGKPRENLIKAAAMAIAEIERLDRLGARDYRCATHE